MKNSTLISRAQIGLIVLCVALAACRPATPTNPKIAQLKQDLLEMDRSLVFQWESGLANTNQFLEALGQFEAHSKHVELPPAAEESVGAVWVLGKTISRRLKDYHPEPSQVVDPQILHDPFTVPKGLMQECGELHCYITKTLIGIEADEPANSHK